MRVVVVVILVAVFVVDIPVPRILADAFVVPRTLPLVPELQLFLLTDQYPRHALSQAEYQRLMAAPPYWAFCWGGGQALARWLLDNPRAVAGHPVVDFGAGSGVAGIAAALAGAASVLAVDIDPDALSMCLHNAQLNARPDAVPMSVADRLDDVAGALLLAADVGYEDEGFAVVARHVEAGGQAVVAESRLRDLSARFPALSLHAVYRVRTFPDLDEHQMFDEVQVFVTDQIQKSL